MEINNLSQVRVNSLISASRAQLMGAFIIVIMLFHGSFDALGWVSYPFCVYGHWGVDVFLFLSGFGVYFSLKKSGHNGLLPFYKRRLVRIIPASVVVGGTLYMCGMTDWLGLLGLNLWYIRTALVLYLFSPVIYHLLVNWHATRALVLLTLLAVVGIIVAVPLLRHSGFVWQTTISWSLARLTAFMLGMYIAHMDFSVKQLLHPAYVIIALLSLLSALYFHLERAQQGAFSNYLHLLPYTLVAFALPLCLVLLSMFIPTKSGGVITFIGSCTLEIYLVHEAIFKKVSVLPYNGITKFLLAYGLSAVAAIVLHYSCRYLCKLSHR